MGFIAFIGCIVILFIALNLRSRVQKLEQFIKANASAGALSGPAVSPSPTQLNQSFGTSAVSSTSAMSATSDASAVPMPPVVPMQPGQEPLDKFFRWFKEDWLLKLGALLLLIGFGWLTTYAFLNNWIGPAGRITLGMVAGVLFMLLGWWRIKKYIHQGGIFLVLGSTTILLTVFAAREIYGYFNSISALAVMFLSTAFVALASVKYRSRSLALVSLVLAGIAPLLTDAPPQNDVVLFSYLFIVVLGAIWIVAITGRRELTTAALVLVALYSLPHLSRFDSASGDIGTLLLFAYAFAAVFFLTNTAGILKSKEKDLAPSLITAAGNGLFLLAWIMVAAPDEWKSLIISAWMIVFAVGAFLIFKITSRREPFLVYAGVGVAMLGAATSAELSGATLTIAYTIEAAMISLVAYFILQEVKIAEKISLLLAVPIVYSVSSIFSRSWSVSVIHKDFFVLLILGLTLLGLGLFFLFRARDRALESQQKDELQITTALIILGSAYIYTLLWLSLHAALPYNDDLAAMLSLLVYTIIGLIAYFYGLANGKMGLRWYGGVLLAIVIARLFLVDVWGMEITGRITTFFLIGALLVSTAFFRRKK